MSMVDEQTAASKRKLCHIAEKGDYVDELPLKSTINKERASVTVGWLSKEFCIETSKVQRRIDKEKATGKDVGGARVESLYCGGTPSCFGRRWQDAKTLR